MVNLNWGYYPGLISNFSPLLNYNKSGNALNNQQNSYIPADYSMEDPFGSFFDSINALDPLINNTNEQTAYANQPFEQMQNPFQMMMGIMMNMMMSFFQIMIGMVTGNNNMFQQFDQNNIFGNNLAGLNNTNFNTGNYNTNNGNAQTNPINALPLDLNNAQTTAFGRQVAQSAYNTASGMNSHGWCLRGVARALAPLGVNLSGASAYQVAGQMANSPKFREVTVTKDQLKNLPAGAVVVWSQSAGSPHGHISVALGDGREASDHVQSQITNLNGSTYRVFIPIG